MFDYIYIYIIIFKAWLRIYTSKYKYKFIIIIFNTFAHNASCDTIRKL